MDDALLPACGVYPRRRFGVLLGGAFREMDVSLAVRLFGEVKCLVKCTDNDE